MDVLQAPVSLVASRRTHTLDAALDPAMCSIEEDRPLREAFVMMSRKHVRQLLVVNATGAPRALLTDLDALRWVSRHARQLARSAIGAAQA